MTIPPSPELKQPNLSVGGRGGIMAGIFTSIFIVLILIKIAYNPTKSLIDLASNDYLGLSTNKTLFENAYKTLLKENYQRMIST